MLLFYIIYNFDPYIFLIAYVETPGEIIAELFMDTLKVIACIFYP